MLRELAAGPKARQRLEDAATDGLLETLVPGMQALMTLRRPALGHRYTVGAHSLLAATMTTSVACNDALAAGLLGEAHDLRVLWAATLLHDAGKATPGAPQGPPPRSPARWAPTAQERSAPPYSHANTCCCRS